MCEFHLLSELAIKVKYAVVTSTILNSTVFSKGQLTAYHGTENHIPNYKMYTLYSNVGCNVIIYIF